MTGRRRPGGRPPRYFSYLDDQSQWQAGERVSGCYAMVSTTHMVRASLRGLGTGPLPY
ncbi:hypothetical protein ABT297_31310 [Dactylosporangium sp. NPDC000555]|uniref:hypothetical protein n=1 Tax=Dactylosporangium sp. NPDC000555 TaxID=3154260 RepID=UPI00331C2C2A